MRSAMSLARVTSLTAAAMVFGWTIAAAQVDFAKVLVGRWAGEISTAKTNLPVVLMINSVKEDGGKWVAEGRSGTTPVRIEIDTSAKQPSLNWTGMSGVVYNVSLVDDKNLVGTATLTGQGANSRSSRDHPVKLEKK
jgi:hypothetical protein